MHHTQYSIHNDWDTLECTAQTITSCTTVESGQIPMIWHMDLGWIWIGDAQWPWVPQSPHLQKICWSLRQAEVSMAICRAAAACKNMTLYQRIAELAGKPTEKYVLPVPSFNVINGGSHAGNFLACQEFMILPVGATNFREALQIGAEVYHTLKKEIQKRYGQDATNVGDEGGFAPNVRENDEAP